MPNRAILFCYLALALSGQAYAFELNFNKVLDVVKKAQQATQSLDEPHEIELGNGIAANLLGAAPLLDNNEVQQYVNKVGRWVSLQTERPDLPWKFGIMQSSDINAFATPGGTIFITGGLLQKLNNESELAGVLAHEMVHVLRKHHLAALQKGARMDLAADLIGESIKNKANPVMEKAIKAGTELYARGLDKDDEFEADRMGIVIATRAGYDPYGLPAVLQMLDASNAQDSSLALMFKTHPAPRDRLALLDKIMGNRFDAYSAPAQADERFNREMPRRK